MSAEEEKWHVRIAPGEIKLLTLEQIDDLFRLDMIDGETLLRQEGSEDWTRLRIVAGLDEEEPVAAAPPALPATSAAPSPVRSAPPPVRSAPPPAPPPVRSAPPPAVQSAPPPPPPPLPPPSSERAPFAPSPSFIPPAPLTARPRSAPPPPPPVPSVAPPAVVAAPSSASPPVSVPSYAPPVSVPSYAPPVSVPSYAPPVAPSFAPPPIAPIAVAPPLRSAGGNRAETWLIGVAALSGLLVTLHRNGVLADIFAGAGLGSSYEALESGLGGPGFGTPRAANALGKAPQK